MSVWNVPFFALLSESSVMSWGTVTAAHQTSVEAFVWEKWQRKWEFKGGVKLKTHKVEDKHRQTDKQKTRQGVGHSHAQRPIYLWTLAQAQNQRQCHWGGRTEGGLRSVFGSSSSSGLGVARGLQGERDRHGITGPEAQVHFRSPTTKILCLLSEIV